MKTKNIFLTVALALCTTFAFAQTGIAASAHNFSTWAVNGNGDASLCDACHTPHQAQTITSAPLWNHAASKVATYTNYDSATMDASPGNPTGTSLLCLSCHDGTTALDSYGSTPTTTKYITTGKVGDATQGTGTSNNLRSEHPISFLYSDAVATDAGLNLEADVVTAGLLGAVGDSVECSSCHDVHNQGAGTYALLKIGNTNSALCTTCHIK